MAPQISDLKNQNVTIKNMKASIGAGVVKRRHGKVRFHENGLLNVERKSGKYLKIARQNQLESRLLRLPPELRHLIFTHALGGKTFEIRYDRQKSIAKNTTVSQHALALLTVCRQVYAETALLPFSSNTFSVHHPIVFNMWIKSFQPAFAEVVTRVRLDQQVSFHIKRFIYDRYRGIPQLQDIARPNDNKNFSYALTSLNSVQIDITVSCGSSEGISVKEMEREEKYIRALHEQANSRIKFTLTWTKI